MTGLPEELATFLDAERDIDAPAPAERARLLERLEPLLLVPVAVVLTSAAVSASATGAVAAEGAATGAAKGAGSAALSAALKGKVGAAIVSAALVGGVVGVAGHAYVASHTPPTTNVAPLRATQALPFVPPVQQPPEITPPTLSALPSARAVPNPPPDERPRPAGSLRAERLLIETASAALLRGDPKSALVALRQHAQRFPKGDLTEEREALLVKALAASGGDAGTQNNAKDSR